MKILITGSSGFIGNNIFSELDCCARGLYPYDIRTGDDILDRRKLDYVFETENIDCVIHCAALTGVRRGELYPQAYFDTNVIGTKNLVDMAEKYNVNKFIHFSSSSIKGNSIYGFSKLAGEKIARRSKIKNMIIVRPFTVIGEFGRPDQVIQKWIKAIRKNEFIKVHGFKTNRNFTYVGDIVRFVKDVVLFDYNSGIYELCNPNSISLQELFDIFTKYHKDIKWSEVGLSDYEPGENKGEWNSEFEPTDNRKIIHSIIKRQL